MKTTGLLAHLLKFDHVTFLIAWMISIGQTVSLLIFGNSRIWLVQDPVLGNYTVNAYSDFMSDLLWASAVITVMLTLALVYDLAEELQEKRDEA